MSDYLLFKPLLDENGEPVVRCPKKGETYLNDRGYVDLATHDHYSPFETPIYTRVTDAEIIERCEIANATHVDIDGGFHPIQSDNHRVALPSMMPPVKTVRITPLTHEPTAEQKRATTSGEAQRLRYLGMQFVKEQQEAWDRLKEKIEAAMKEEPKP